MDEKAIRDIALFFFFSLLDEEKAFQLASKSVDLYVDLKEKNPQISSDILIVKATGEILRQQRSDPLQGLQRLSQKFGYYWGNEVNLGPWIDFQKHAHVDNLSVFIWSILLGYRDVDVAAALELSPGTIRYRNDHSLKIIGTHVDGN